MSFDRRRFLACSPALLATPLDAAGGSATPGHEPGWVTAGPFRVLPIVDGRSTIATAEVPGASVPQVTTVMAHLVVWRGQRILVGSGAGGRAGVSGRGVVAGLADAGLQPDAIDVVLLTHLHPEHAGGMVDPQGRPVFINARVVCCRTEWRWWNENERPPGLPARYRDEVGAARAATRPYQQRDRVRFFSGTEEVLPGIVGSPALGHTAGHSIFRIADGGTVLATIGDAVHLPALQLADPGATTLLDMQPDLAATTRRQLLAQAVDDGAVVLGSHLDVPPVARIARRGDGFAARPA